MTLIPIILSGGAGTRLWPLSWGDHPKQFLPLVSERTMIQETLLRLKGLELGAPVISCGEAHRFMVAQQIGEVLPQVVSTSSTTAKASSTTVEADETSEAIKTNRIPLAVAGGLAAAGLITAAGAIIISKKRKEDDEK